MASIIHRGPYQFQALIRRKGYPTQTRTFESQKDAKKITALLNNMADEVGKLKVQSNELI
jgi:hypothetical protein